MKQKDKKQKLSGKEGFETYYSAIFGERWNQLKKALLSEANPVEYKIEDKESYFLDVGSVMAARALPLKNASTILDLCAAPGGKTLVLASCMEKNASLLSNERSPQRKLRLKHTVENCLPEEIQNCVQVICKDGATLCTYESNRFDRILLDAPCSSERHVLLDENYLKDWSPSRIKTLSVAQWALISSAWRMLNDGGFLLYSTCALNETENDLIIGKLLKKFDNAKVCQELEYSNVSEFCSCAFPEAEKTKYGFHILPDFCNGAGPLYYCLLQKVIN